MISYRRETALQDAL